MHQNCCYLRIISLVTLIRRVNLIINSDIDSLMELVFCNIQLNLLNQAPLYELHLSKRATERSKSMFLVPQNAGNGIYTFKISDRGTLSTR